jgi:hypothetical protein
MKSKENSSSSIKDLKNYNRNNNTNNKQSCISSSNKDIKSPKAIKPLAPTINSNSSTSFSIDENDVSEPVLNLIYNTSNLNIVISHASTLPRVTLKSMQPASILPTTLPVLDNSKKKSNS